MIGEICKYLKNYFVYDRANIYFDEYTIEDGAFADGLPFLQEGQYFRITGSVFNDGVYTYPASGLKDETFNGSIWAMFVPADFVELVKDIEDWCELDAVKAATDSPYTSESFGGYSYSKESGSDGTLNWQGHFRARLALYRKAAIL